MASEKAASVGQSFICRRLPNSGQPHLIDDKSPLDFCASASRFRIDLIWLVKAPARAAASVSEKLSANIFFCSTLRAASSSSSRLSFSLTASLRRLYRCIRRQQQG